MKNRLFFFVTSFFLLHPPSLGSLLAASPARTVITYADFSEKQGVLFVAQDHGFFRKNDLDVQLVYMRSGAVAMSALLGGDSDLNTSSASGAVFGAIAGGADVVFVAGLINKLVGELVVSPEIKTPSDLKGKTIGVVSIGGGVWVFTMLAFDHWGLEPKRDKINIRVIGNDPVLAQSIANRVIDGAYLNHAYVPALERQGFRVLAELGKLGIPFQGTALLTRRGYLRSSRDTVEKVLRASVQAIGFIQDPSNKAGVMRSLAKWLRLPRVEDALEGYESMQTIFDPRIYPSVEGIRNTIRLLCTTNRKICSLKAEDAVDDSIVKKLEKDGVFGSRPR
ncbi:MAG: ABC transporter substrate-binding protein [Deltaproteobacteria bacterium]|nr:ABC transporter substrate-binding protein [Deltaproteobacteria bacterium]